MNQQLASLTFSGTPYEVFKRVDDQFWLWLHTEGLRDLEVQKFLPSLPDEETQIRFTGKTGKNNLTQAFNADSLFKKIALKHGPIDAVLDFGCGWGRILRYWLKDLPANNIYGIDCLTEAVDACRKTGLEVNLALTNPAPPPPYPKTTLA